MRATGLCAFLLIAVGGQVLATQTVLLPAVLCAPNDSIFIDDFDASGVIPHDPSLGIGGDYPSNQQRTIIMGSGSHEYYLHVPAAYAPGQSAPLVIVLHGAAGPGSADQQATTMRNDWSAAADRYGFIVLAPVATGPHGGWEVPGDYDVIVAELTDVEQRYNIELSRISLWGFSAGGDVAWDMLLNGTPLALNASTLAALASSGSSSVLACQGDQNTCDSRIAALPRKVPIDMHIGLQDYPPLLQWVRDDRQRLLNNGWIEGRTLSYTEFNGGHTLPLPQLDEIGGFMCRFAVGP